MLLSLPKGPSRTKKHYGIVRSRKAVVDMISWVFQDLGIYRRLGDAERNIALGRWW